MIWKVRSLATTSLILSAILCLVSCGKKESVPASAPVAAPAPQQPQVVAAVVHKLPLPPVSQDPVVAAQQYAQQMDRTEAVRCGGVFSSAIAPLRKAGEKQQSNRALLFGQATKYLADVPLPDNSAPPPKYPEIEAAVKRESKDWSRSQMDANLGYCFNRFQSLYALLDAAGKIDKRIVAAKSSMGVK